MSAHQDRRIARNSVFLYARMLISIVVQLYTSRVVLEMLGIDDYGIYNLVGAVITIFTFLNNSMAGATQRFLNYEMGRGDSRRLCHTFASSVLIHTAIALIVVALGEAVGVWYINHRMVISPDRLYAANWTFQLSLAGAVCAVVQVPFMASVIAHERMDAYAAITLINTFLKLGVALSLSLFGTADTLIVYAALMLGVSLLTLLCYAVFARINFAECRPARRAPRNIVRSLLGFSLGDFFGNLCYVLRLQSVAVILNGFGGEALNAAVGLNMMVSSNVNQFGTTLLAAFRPQIVQQYARGNLAYMQRLMTNCAKYSLLMVALVAVPVIVSIHFLLSIWLVEVPPYTADFCRLTIVAGAAELVVYTLNCGVHATGRIKLMSIVTGAIYLGEIPTMWLLLRLTDMPWIVYALHVAVMGLVIVSVGLILRRLIPTYALGQFLRNGPGAALLIIIPAAVAAWAVTLLTPAGWLSLGVATAVSTAVIGALAWRYALDADTRAKLTARLPQPLSSLL